MVRVGLFESLVYQGTLGKIRRSGIGCETGCGIEDPLRLGTLMLCMSLDGLKEWRSGPSPKYQNWIVIFCRKVFMFFINTFFKYFLLFHIHQVAIVHFSTKFLRNSNPNRPSAPLEDMKMFFINLSFHPSKNLITFYVMCLGIDRNIFAPSKENFFVYTYVA